MRPARLIIAIALLVATTTLRAPADNANDGYRKDVAQDIERDHGVKLDWRKYDLGTLMSIQSRIAVAKEIESEHRLRFDWQKHSLSDLMSIQSRIATTKEIAREHGVKLDWQKHTLSNLMDTQARLDVVARIKRDTGKSLDWRKHSLSQLLAMEKPARPDPKQRRQEVAAPPADAPVGGFLGNAIEARIDGEFEGWDGDTIVKLTNGQIWQQTDAQYTYHYTYNPEVLLFNSGGGWKMRVNGVDRNVRVDRLK